MDARLLDRARVVLSERLDPAPLVIGALTPSASSLNLTLEWAEAGQRSRLILDTEGDHATLHLLGGSRAAEGDRSPFADPLVGRRLLRLERLPGEPILLFSFSPPRRDPGAAGLLLYAEWTGRHGNLRLVEPDGVVLAVQRRAGVAPGEGYTPPRRREAGNLHPRSNETPEEAANLLALEDPEAFHAEARRLYLTHLNQAQAEERRANQRRSIQAETKRLMRLRRHLEEERGDPQQGLRLRRSGEAILSHLREIKKGMPSYAAVGWAPDGGVLEIELDPARPPTDNAEEYFRRARSWDRGEPHRKRRIEEIDRAVARLSVLESRIAESERPPGDESFPAKLDEALGLFRRRSAAGQATGTGRERGKGVASPGSPKRSESARGATGGRRGDASARRPTSADARANSGFRPRSFRTSEGWTVLVGRSNQENDWLTHKHAHPEDLWLHAHGVPGSHVVLRREGRKSNPSAKTLEEAAAIAAFYSKARHSTKAPVIYTLRKHVRKPRGAKAGLAVCEREKMIMVRPKDPTEGQEPEWMEE